MIVIVSEEQHDAWNDGSSYENYMGRWSRLIANRFIEWIDQAPNQDWMEVGCGSGALTSTILDQTNPRSVLAIDPSEGFVNTTLSNASDSRLSAKVGDGTSLGADDSSKDAVVSGLVLNFIPDQHKALSEMRRVSRPGGCVAFYVWDYPGAGVEFMRHFWNAAIEVDPEAVKFTEGTRFAYCNEDDLRTLAENAGLSNLKSRAIEVPSVFRSFDDYWLPFTLGVGPAPGYCANLPAAQREQIRAKLEADLPIAADGSIELNLRAWAISGAA